MERVIKFRALKDDISNCTFIYGSLIYDKIANPCIEYSNKRLYSTCLPGSEGQFTGLIDINGKEIFEGDILRDRVYDPEAPNGEYYESFLPIFFENGAFWIDESFEKNRTTATILCEWENPEVVGNIHENPELLNFRS
jgi:uncharacterized phage protein (TIGR01671 family)